MRLAKQKPKQTLNPAFRRQRPGRTEIDLFKQNLRTLLSKIDESESEEHVKNQLRDFLRDTYYKETNEVNTKGRQDLVIHTGKTNELKVAKTNHLLKNYIKSVVTTVSKYHSRSHRVEMKESHFVYRFLGSLI